MCTPSKGRCDQISGGVIGLVTVLLEAHHVPLLQIFFLERARRVLRLHSVITNNIGFGR